MKETGRELGGVRGGISIAVVRDRLNPQAGQGAVLFSRQFSADVIVAGKGIRLKIFHPVLDPLHRLAGQDRGRNGDHIAGVNRNLAAETAADIRRDDADLLFGKSHVSRHQGKDGPDSVRRLGRHPDGQLPVHLVEVRDATAGLDGGDMDPRQVNVLLDRDFGFLENFVGCSLIANFPVPDVVVFFIFLVGAKHRRARLQSLERIDDHRQRLVVHLDRLHTIGRDVSVRGEHRRDFLGLIHHFLYRQNHLGVGHERRHPVKIVFGEILTRDHGQHSRYGQGFSGIDFGDLGVSIRASHDVQPDHPRKPNIIDIIPLTADKARILLALYRMTHSADFRTCFGHFSSSRLGSLSQLLRGILNRLHDIHVTRAAAQVARDRKRISSSLGLGFSFNRATLVIIMPGVQKPHCSPCSCQNPS